MDETFRDIEAALEFDCTQHIADNVIDVLRNLDVEYDSLLKHAEERLNGTQYEVKNPEVGQQYFVNDFVDQNVTILNDLKRKWEEEELTLRTAEIQDLVRGIRQEKRSYMEKKTMAITKIKVEEMKIDDINNEISKTQLLGENIQTTQEKLKIVINDLDNLSVEECIYPTSLLEMNLVFSGIQNNVKEMETELLRYSDLPPDYSQAQAKLVEVMKYEKELDKRLRNAVKL